MKNMFKVVLAALLVAGFVACSKAPDAKLLHAKWKLSEVKTEGTLTEEKKQEVESLKNLAGKMTWEFKADSTFIMAVDTFEMKSKWFLTADGKNIVTQDESGTDTMGTFEVTADKLTFFETENDVKYQITLKK